MSTARGHHVYMMCGGGSDKVGGKEAGGDDFSTMQIVTLYNHGGRHHHMAAMGLEILCGCINQTRPHVGKVPKYQTVLGTLIHHGLGNGWFATTLMRVL